MSVKTGVWQLGASRLDLLSVSNEYNGRTLWDILLLNQEMCHISSNIIAGVLNKCNVKHSNVWNFSGVIFCVDTGCGHILNKFLFVWAYFMDTLKIDLIIFVLTYFFGKGYWYGSVCSG